MKNISGRLKLMAWLMLAATVSSRPVEAQPPAAIPPETPEQRQQAARTAVVENMRLLMRIYELTDVNLQDTIIEFLKAQGAKRYTVKAQRDKLFNKRNYALLSDSQVLALLNEYRATARQVQQDYTKSLLDLDAQIGFSKNPRLEVILVSLGVIGDEESVSSGPARFAVFAEPPQAEPPQAELPQADPLPQAIAPAVKPQ